MGVSLVIWKCSLRLLLVFCSRMLKTGVKGGKYGPMGEDLFAEKCMEKHGVAKVEAFDISIDGACPADRPDNLRKYKKWHGNCKDVVSAASIHPFKKPEDYFDCLEATTNAAAQV